MWIPEGTGRLLLTAVALTLLVLLLGAACDDPHVGDPCTPRSRYTHITDTRHVDLYCNDKGQWEKA